MIKNKISDHVIKQPNFQYPYYWLVGVLKQFKYFFSERGIAYSGQQPFLLIVGSGRSGNTLLRKLLMENCNIYIPPESYVLGQEVITHLNASMSSSGVAFHNNIILLSNSSIVSSAVRSMSSPFISV